MKSVDVTEAQARFDEILEEAQRQPIVIRREGVDCAIVLSSIATTLNIYTHVVDASHRAAIEQVERQLFPTVPKSPEADTPSDSVSVTKRVG